MFHHLKNKLNKVITVESHLLRPPPFSPEKCYLKKDGLLLGVEMNI